MYQKYVELLEKHNVTTYQVCKETGLNQAMFTMWKQRAETDKKATINIYDLKKIADFFGVPIEYFVEE